MIDDPLNCLNARRGSALPQVIGNATLYIGDCLEVLRTLPDCSVDSIVTDPPYGLGKEPDAMAMLADWLATGHHDVKGAGFMGKAWDAFVPQPALWRECLRVLKPGGHLLAFAGTRTHDLMTLGLRIAGFEIRDTIMWVYGSGFPKSLDVSKAIDKRRDWSLVERLAEEIKRARAESGMSLAEIGQATLAATEGTYGKWYHRGGHMFFETGRSLPSRPEWEHLRHVLPIAPEFAEVYDEAEREVLRTAAGSRLVVAPGQGNDRGAKELAITAPATDAARRWVGWGTALKPSLETITVARKPLVGTVAENVLAHGTGALNIDGCRVAAEGEVNPSIARRKGAVNHLSDRPAAEAQAEGKMESRQSPEAYRAERAGEALGRWPANLIHDGSDDVVALFPVAGGGFGKRGGRDGATVGEFGMGATMETVGYGDAGSAARFFYCTKASKRDRGEGNNHPTVKPTDLMRYLCRLVTPPGGTVLDPFTGSGSTGKAARLEGFAFIGIEREPKYFDIACRRIEDAQRQSRLFDEQPEPTRRSAG